MLLPPARFKWTSHESHPRATFRVVRRSESWRGRSFTGILGRLAGTAPSHGASASRRQRIAFLHVVAYILHCLQTSALRGTANTLLQRHLPVGCSESSPRHSSGPLTRIYLPAALLRPRSPDTESDCRLPAAIGRWLTVARHGWITAGSPAALVTVTVVGRCSSCNGCAIPGVSWQKRWNREKIGKCPVTVLYHQRANIDI